MLTIIRLDRFFSGEESRDQGSGRRKEGKKRKRDVPVILKCEEYGSGKCFGALRLR